MGFDQVREDIFEVSSEGMAVTELASRLAINSAEIVKTLFLKGIMVQVNQVGWFLHKPHCLITLPRIIRENLGRRGCISQNSSLCQIIMVPFGGLGQK